VETYLKLINHKHLERVGILHWLWTLVSTIPVLAKHRSHVSLLFRTHAVKHCVPAHPTMVHSLATSSKNETVTTELKDALLDFFNQVGHSHDDYMHQLLLVGGDGLTYENIFQSKKYLQCHKNKFESFTLVEPLLEPWYTEATDLSCVFETHWGIPLSEDPLMLGHSARKIGHNTPLNLKKVDYYPSAALMYLALEVRQLDCWQ
jgi:hypothetical protein